MLSQEEMVAVRGCNEPKHTINLWIKPNKLSYQLICGVCKLLRLGANCSKGLFFAS